MSTTDVVEQYQPNFEAWIDEFNEWQTRIGFDPAWLGDYRFEIKFDWDTAGDTIEFGDFEGMPKWDRRMQIPQQTVRDAIISMVSVQGDTEFASVEQQNHLLDTAPTEYDKKSALRIMCEEQRHGWQMACWSALSPKQRPSGRRLGRCRSHTAIVHHAVGSWF